MDTPSLEFQIMAAACRKRAIPYVVEPIGMFMPIVRNLWLKRLYHRLWGRKLLQGASHVVGTSEQEIEELLAGGIPRTKVLMRRNGVEVPKSWPESGMFRKALGISKDTKLVLFLGRLSVKKSPDLLLRAFAEIVKRFGGMPLMLVFAGPDEGGVKSQLEQLASYLGVRANVQITGPVFGRDKWAAYRDADVFVLPSQNENFGNTAAEAIACGTPVVVTDCCGIAPLVDGTAGIVVSHSEESIRAALMSLLQDDSLRRLLKSKCDEVVSRLSWEEPIATMEALYRNLVAKGNPAG